MTFAVPEQFIYTRNMSYERQEVIRIHKETVPDAPYSKLDLKSPGGDEDCDSSKSAGGFSRGDPPKSFPAPQLKIWP